MSSILYNCKLVKENQVDFHIVKMISYIKRLANLGFIMYNEVTIDLILKSFPQSWENFIMNFNLSEKEKSLKRLLYMLKTVE